MSNLARADKCINVTWRSENNGSHNQTLHTKETIPRALELLLEVSIAWGGNLEVDSPTSLRSMSRVLATTDYYTMSGDENEIGVLTNAASLVQRSNRDPYVALKLFEQTMTDLGIELDRATLMRIGASQRSPTLRRVLIIMLVCGIRDPLDLDAGITFVQKSVRSLMYSTEHLFPLMELALEMPEMSLREIIGQTGHST
ncbi:hypothetical protein KBC54_01190 [Patescibacteria group bacterium]|nr:hypothetical protein [Patescibacteria group bacterium]